MSLQNFQDSKTFKLFTKLTLDNTKTYPTKEAR